MKQPVLTTTQTNFLHLFSQSHLAKEFYLTGGTTLAAYYIPYRLSEDLDFFSEKEVDAIGIAAFLKSIQKELRYTTFDSNTSFNRNLFFLTFPKEVLKVEFTYFPFPQIEKPMEKDGVLIDSVMDIAANKLFTIYQKPRSRDFMDLYMIHKTFGFTLDALIKKSRIKFDWHIDPIKLGSQLLLCTELKDYPKFLEPIPENEWQGYFLEEAKRLGKKIME